MSLPGWPNAREVVAGALIGLFTFVLVKNPHDQAIIGALLTAFATAYGFYLGGSKVGSDTAEKNAASVVETAKASTPTGEPQPVIVTNTTAEAVPVETK